MPTWTAPRDWVSGEVVTAALLNTHLRDNMKVGRGFSQATRTAGNLTLDSTLWATASTTLDLVLTAAANDRIAVELSASLSTANVNVGFDAIAANSGTHFSGVSGNNAFGHQAWYSPGNNTMGVGGMVIRTLTTGDISGGNVTVRLRYRCGSTAARTVNASTTRPLRFAAFNLGPAV